MGFRDFFGKRKINECADAGCRSSGLTYDFTHFKPLSHYMPKKKTKTKAAVKKATKKKVSADIKKENQAKIKKMEEIIGRKLTKAELVGFFGGNV